MKKKMLMNCIAMAIMAILGTGCSNDAPGAMADPEPAVSVVKVSGLDQTLTGLDNGYYDLEFYARGNGSDEACWVKAGDKVSTCLLTASSWTHGAVKGIQVKDGTLALSNGGLDNATAQCEYTAISLRKASGPQTFIKGGDVSMLSQVEKNDGKYYDASGKQGDCLELLKQQGVNLVRLRLYNDPGNSEFYPSSEMFPGVQDEADVLALAKRAKALGMQIELTFHYSDNWTNGAEQYKPHAWKDYTMDQLKAAMHDYTVAFLGKMKAQGTPPEYVSLGNEIQSGILFGKIGADGNPTEEVNGYCGNMMTLSALLNEASKAVRETCPESKIILHLSTGTTINKDSYIWFFTAMQQNKVDYDIIGASYYPFYGNFSVETICEWADYLSDRYGKDFIFMETGFAWAEKMPDGTDGQISNNLPYTAMTPAAQRHFLLQLSEGIKNISSGRVLGYIYWDPIYIAAPNCGWKANAANCTANSTLFDFDGRALPAFDAFKYNN